jgi:hypothetical protein
MCVVRKSIKTEGEVKASPSPVHNVTRKAHDEYLAELEAMESKTKPSNPKDAVATLTKVGLSYIPVPVTYEVGLAMMEGGFKYGRHNYRVVGVRASVYYDAAKRHLDAFWEGEDFDPDSKARIHHISKAIAGLMVLRDSIMRGNWVDDRPPSVDPGWMQTLHVELPKLLEQYPNPVPAFTQVDVS